MTEGMRLLSVFIAPNRLFADLTERRSRWWLPLIIIIIVAAATAVILRLAIPAEVWLETMRQNIAPSGAEMNQEYLELAVSRLASPLALLFAGLGGALQVTAVTFILGLIFWAVFAIFGGKINFTKSITIVTYTGLISALGILVRVILSVALQRLDIQTSLAVIPLLETNTYLFRLASQIEFFMVWRLLVMGLGFSILASVSRTKGYLLVILPWLALVALVSLLKIGIGM
ncbi:YIP1 family protein [candidate division WOR-3 bacterium]|nr:YIP1 family protein [candidate division WOR-3 bacterium]